MAVFAQLTDFHLRPPGVLTLGQVDTDRMTSAAIEKVIVNHGDVDAVLVTGDVTDLGEEDAYSRAAMLLSRFSAPVIVVPGNHDDSANLREAFAAFPGHAAPPVPGKACHVHEVDGVTVVALDTSVDNAAHGELGPEQRGWLDETLDAAGPALIAMHHPPFTTGLGFMDTIGLRDAAAFAQIVSRHGNVLRIVCGHVHRVIVGEVGGVPTMAVPGVAHQVPLGLRPDEPPGMVMEPPTYAIHLVNADSAVSHMGYVDDYGGPIRPGDA